MGDTTFNVLDSAAATVTFRAQAVVGTTLVMMSVPSDPAGTAIIGQKTMASSISVAFASNQSTMTAFLAGGTASLAGGTALVTLAGGTGLVTLAGGTAALAGGTASVTLAGGTASVNLNQVGGSTFGLGQAVMATSLPVAIASNQSAIPVTGAGGTSTVTLAGGTALVTLAGGTALVTLAGGTAILAGGTTTVTLAGGTALVTLAGGTTLLAGGTTSVNLNQVGGSTFALGQAVMATSIPVAIASNQSPIPVTGSFTISTADVNLIKVGGTTISIGQAVMTASLPVVLPSNMIASAKLTDGTNAAAIKAASTAPSASDPALVVALSPNGLNANGQTTTGNSAPVVLPSDQIVSTNLMQVGAVAFGLGQAVMATSIPVAIASNQSAFPVTNAGGTATVTLAGGTALVTNAGGTVALAGGTALVTLAGGTTLLAGGTASVNLNQVGGSTFALGQSVMATSLSVAMATDQASLSFAHDSNRLMNGASGSTMTPKFALIAVLATSGVNQIVTAVASRKIRVIAWDAVPNGAVNIKWQSSTTDLTGLYYLAAAGNGVARGWNPNGYFETAVGSTLNVNLSATVAIGGCLTYVEV